MMLTYPPELLAVNQYYQGSSPLWCGRYETLKVAKTSRGRRMICVCHDKWPIPSTRCFSLSLSQLQNLIHTGTWILDPVASNPALQVSEGL